LREVEGVELSGDVESGKLSVLREKRRGLTRVNRTLGRAAVALGAGEREHRLEHRQHADAPQTPSK